MGETQCFNPYNTKVYQQKAGFPNRSALEWIFDLQRRGRPMSEVNANLVIERIKQQIANHTVLLYMKGNPDFPACGFSARVAHILNHLKTSYAYVNILDNPDIRATLPAFAKWPTFPQLYIQGELVGGCDIVTELFEQGELLPMLVAANAVGTNSETVMAE